MRIKTPRTLDEIDAALALGDNLDDEDMRKIVSALCDVLRRQAAAIRELNDSLEWTEEEPDGTDGGRAT